MARVRRVEGRSLRSSVYFVVVYGERNAGFGAGTHSGFGAFFGREDSRELGPADGAEEGGPA
jgi:hypothetical protein